MAARQSDDTVGGMAVVAAQSYGYHLSTPRIFALSLISFGLYLFYWVYRTWDQYREHTGANVYPVWHALAMLVPCLRVVPVLRALQGVPRPHGGARRTA